MHDSLVGELVKIIGSNDQPIEFLFIDDTLADNYKISIREYCRNEITAIVINCFMIESLPYVSHFKITRKVQNYLIYSIFIKNEIKYIDTSNNVLLRI